MKQLLSLSLFCLILYRAHAIGHSITIPPFFQNLNSSSIKNYHSMRFPELNFKENSLEFETDTLIINVKPEETIRVLFSVLVDNPSIVIELSAHCDSKEKNKMELSVKRANLLKNILIKKGIEKERIKTKGYGDQQLLISETIIQKEKSISERKVLRAKNRRMNFKVLSFDYGVKKNPKKETSKKTEDDDE